LSLFFSTLAAGHDCTTRGVSSVATRMQGGGRQVTNNPRMNDVDREHFSEVVENSFAIAGRHQFFAWTQSSLQSLLPHEILICGIEDGSRQGMAMHKFSASRYFRDEHFNEIADPLVGLRPRVMAAVEGSRSLLVFCPNAAPSARVRSSDVSLAKLVEDNEMKNLAAHLVTGASGKVEALYGFSRIPVPLDARLGHIIELLIPHLHNAFLRVLATEREISSAGSQRMGRLVTPRQEEILTLIKEGKTNAEIAALLDCSPWTIKNHIQAILRRLDSNTRTHAISRAMSLGILKPD
jgi:transcriptional regulator EpsA